MKSESLKFSIILSLIISCFFTRAFVFTKSKTPQHMILEHLKLTREELLVGVEENRIILKCPTDLKNTYYGLRHGESEANKLGVISSDPIIGSKMYGLTALGKAQSRSAATAGYKNLLFVSSFMISIFYV